jgi:hypothetical protein
MTDDEIVSGLELLVLEIIIIYGAVLAFIWPRP